MPGTDSVSCHLHRPDATAIATGLVKLVPIRERLNRRRLFQEILKGRMPRNRSGVPEERGAEVIDVANALVDRGESVRRAAKLAGESAGVAASRLLKSRKWGD